MQDICEVIGITKPTLYKWIKESDLIKQALSSGKDTADAMVQNALFTNAISGNVLAQIFWLKNRRPQQWRDKVIQEVETDTENEVGGVMFLPRTLDEDLSESQYDRLKAHCDEIGVSVNDFIMQTIKEPTESEDKSNEQ